MSDLNTTQLPTGGFTFPPVSVVQYDEAGNAFYQGANGCRYYTQFPPPNVQPAPHGTPIAIAGHVQLASTSTAGAGIPIDPALIALPETPNDDLSDGPTIALAQGHTATTKVAGACQDKGKGRAIELASQSKGKSQPTSSRKRKCSDDEDDEPDDNLKCSHPKGAGNYTTDDVTALLDAMESERPLGMRGYQAVHHQFTQWARRNGRPERALKSLETKFKQLVKTKKPTGDAYCPPEVKRAHLIDELITERAHTHDVSNGELDGSDGADSNEDIREDESQPVPKSTKKCSLAHDEDLSDVDVPVQSRRKTDKICEAIVCCPDAQAPAPARAPRNAASTLMARLSDAFDPAAQAARDTSRADRSMQNAHFLSLTQQLHDANVTIEGLHTQISVLQTQVHNAERACDRAELKLEMLQLSHPANPITPGPQQPMQPPPHPPSRHRTRSHHSRRPPRSPETVALLQRTNGKSCVMHRYPDGGSWTTWVTDPSSESGSESGLGSSEKENILPQSSSSHVRYTTSQKGSTCCRLSYKDEDNDHSYIIPPPSAFHHTSPFFASQPVFSTLDTNAVAGNVEGSAESSKDAE